MFSRAAPEMLVIVEPLVRAAPVERMLDRLQDTKLAPAFLAEFHLAMAREHFYPLPFLLLSRASILDRAVNIFRVCRVTGWKREDQPSTPHL